MCLAYMAAGAGAGYLAGKKSGKKKNALGIAKDVANKPEVKKASGGLAGRLIR